jgi:hypothetical protein
VALVCTWHIADLSELIYRFAALWFGIAAVVVSILFWLFPSMSFTLQVVCWIILSIIMYCSWFKFIKPLSIDKTKAGLSREQRLVKPVWSFKLDSVMIKFVVRFQCLFWVLMNGIAVLYLLYKLVTVYV